MKPSLVILAAGMASRYGSMKQTDGFGPNGETIIEYSIYDAIKAGFGKVIFVIKEEFADSFRSIFEPKLNGKIETDYVFQTFNIKQYGVEIDIERAKPWGTAHATLAAKDVVKEPFCVINADDFYGAEAYQKMYDFLTTEVSDDKFSLIGFQIDKTLSDYGSVSRGVCEVDDSGNMTAVNERVKVYFKKDADGNNTKEVAFEEGGREFPLKADSRVSMNFWGFTPKIFELSAIMFKEFALANQSNPKAEFFIPLVADELIKTGKAVFKVIPTQNKWFGVTYVEDKPIVQESIDKLVADGVYPGSLWN